MAQVFFNPLNYWLILTALLVIIDRIAGDRLHFVLAGVAAFAAAFLASLSFGLIWQIAVFVVVAVLLLVFALKPLQRIRRSTLRAIEEALEWYNKGEVVVIEEICSGRPGKVLVDGHVLPARANKRIAAGTSVSVAAVRPAALCVRLRDDR
jgi:membrane protein implicated in regulation of membrane protease activity